MAILGANGKKKNGILRLKIVAEKLQKGLSMAWRPNSEFKEEEEEEEDDSGRSSGSSSSKNVKGGHFAVIAVDENCKPKRFVVPLRLLHHPAFLILLEQAAEEFGFDHEGVVCVPCHWREMEKILATNTKRG